MLNPALVLALFTGLSASPFPRMPPAVDHPGRRRVEVQRTASTVQRRHLLPPYHRRIAFPSVDDPLFLPDGRSLILAGEDHVEVRGLPAFGVSGRFPVSSWISGCDLEAAGVGKLRVVRTAGSLKILDPHRANLLSGLYGADEEIYWLALSPDQSMIVTAGRKVNSVWSSSSGKLIQSLGPGAPGDPRNLPTFSPDGKLLAEGYLRGVSIWDTRSWTGVSPLSCGRRSAWFMDGLAFSPDGKLVAAQDDEGDVFVWRVWHSRLLHHWKTPDPHSDTDPNWFPKDDILAFSPNQRWLACGGGDGRIRLWDLSTGRLTMSTSCFHSPLDHVAFSPDSSWLAVGSSSENRVVVFSAGRAEPPPIGNRVGRYAFQAGDFGRCSPNRPAPISSR